MNIKHPAAGDYSGLLSLWKEAFGDTDEYIKIFFETAFSKNRCRCVTDNGRVVAALYWFDCSHLGKKTAYIYAVATASSHRGKGICNTLMKDTHTLLEGLGYTGAILVPGSKSLFDFYEKMGYKICSYIKEFDCESAKTGTLLSQLSKEEYAIKRREFLPENSVIQENENLEFLSAQALFYKGEDFILAMRHEKDKLFGIELLGNINAAPGILNSLAVSKGTFRTPGNNKPFAMYLPIGKTHLPAPSYFGFAFD